MRTSQVLLAILIGLWAAATAAAGAEETKRSKTPPAQPQTPDYAGQLGAKLEPTRVVVYKKVGERELHLNLFEPEGHRASDRRACFLSIHGGGWTGLSPRRQYPFAAHFAKLGMVGISVEYRLAKRGSVAAGAGTTVFDCVKDSRSAMRWKNGEACTLT